MTVQAQSIQFNEDGSGHYNFEDGTKGMYFSHISPEAEAIYHPRGHQKKAVMCHPDDKDAVEDGTLHWGK